MCDECLVCIWFDNLDTNFLTLSELEQYSKRSDCVYSMKDYTDGRKNTNIAHFDYCPNCGKKIDWKSIRKFYKDKEKN